MKSTWRFALVLAICGGLWAQTGVVRGRVGTKALTPLTGVRVSLSRTPEKNPNRNSTFTPWSAGTRVDANGNYEIANVPPGEYSLCAEVPEGLYLNPCVWDKPISVEVATKKSNEMVVQNILMELGAVLLVTLDDPAGRLADTFSRGPNSGVQVFVRGRPAALKLTNRRQLVYALAVPRNGNHKIEVSSPGFRFRDGGTGNEGNRLKTDVAGRPGELFREVTLSVVGVPSRP